MARWAIAIHGGAGVDPNLPEHRQEEAKRVLARCLQVGVDALRSGAAVLDVVEAVVRELESDPFFNSGRGSALTRLGTVEMEASIMDGRGRRCGAVSGVSTVKNPVSLARLVMDKSPHSYLAFDGAEQFARDQVNYLSLINPHPTNKSLPINYANFLVNLTCLCTLINKTFLMWNYSVDMARGNDGY